MVTFTGFAALQHQADLRVRLGAYQMVVHGAHGEQGRDGHPVRAYARSLGR